MHLFIQAHSHKWNTKEELGKDKHETPTRQRLLVVVGTEIFTIATPARGCMRDEAMIMATAGNMYCTQGYAGQMHCSVTPLDPSWEVQ